MFSGLVKTYKTYKTYWSPDYNYQLLANIVDTDIVFLVDCGSVQTIFSGGKKWQTSRCHMLDMSSIYVTSTIWDYNWLSRLSIKQWLKMQNISAGFVAVSQ